MGLIALLPIIGWWKTGHRFNVAFMWALVTGIVLLTGLRIWKCDESRTSGRHRRKPIETPTASENWSSSQILTFLSRVRSPYVGRIPFTQGPRRNTGQLPPL